jgi:hypothetical protein
MIPFGGTSKPKTGRWLRQLTAFLFPRLMKASFQLFPMGLFGRLKAAS